ncbi:MAG: signal peptidase I [Gemmatimonadetes bacterium]|uniref:Signal peptidase I n=1 Tax=Candidatus Kutchimonas denitrificans TaxID=3056748 RepID=A0AAE5CCQ0_9BACT|nr:signal peptidase I [Gemmatimonadota bacterium]NIR76248.1 signal peptidase I [Candidatus Kutchimonas denitrificans]NIS00688.1 signal peptidase I [Gemmatimonadota bacterium]NIT66833.1 signal peptidase I [Gemmatimonadota bacterium]NIV23432.1 signal peptidase I [Gemmatimonadota bacterium]
MKQSGKDAAEPRPRRRAQTQNTGRWLWEWVKSISVAILLFLIIRTFVVEAFKIPTGSMEDTLLVGDFLLVNKAVYGAQVPFTGIRLPAFDTPERGDVIVFEYPLDRSKNYVKRVVGLPGDTVEMRNGELYVNSNIQVESYVQHTQPNGDYYDPSFEWQRDFLPEKARRNGYRPTRDDWGPIIVPPDRYFVMGDNRDNSQDSRYWGFVDRSLIKGRPLIIYYSFDRSKLRPLPWLTEVRWDRVGNRVE